MYTDTQVQPNSARCDCSRVDIQIRDVVVTKG